MLWRTYLLNRLIGPRDILFLVGRHPVVYAKILIQYTAILLVLFLLWSVLGTTFPSDRQHWSTMTFGIVAGIGYIRFVFRILRQYFDVLVGTREHLYIVERDSFVKYSMRIVGRGSVQDITFSPSGSLGSLMHEYSIIISTEQDEVIHFNHIYHADRVVKKMYVLRDALLYPEEAEEKESAGENTITDDEKFKVLVETLGEVIVDYMKKKE